MHITLFGSRIIGNGILTYVIGAYLIGHLKLVCTWQMVVYSLGGISTFMIYWWGTSLMYILIMFLYTLMIYIMHSWCLEECIQETGIQEFFFSNGMGWRALLIIGVQCKQWDPGIVFSTIDFKLFGKQAVWEMDSPLNKVILIRVVQQKSWRFLSKIFMESQRLKVGKLYGNFKESYRKHVLQHLCFKLLEEKKYWEWRIFHVPNFSLGHNGLIKFSIFIRVCQIDAKGQIIAKDENY